jgi:RES domain-containing protein
LRFSGTVFRAHNPRWSFAPTSGDGAKRHGGRFNRPGVPALYTSLRYETAWAEAQQAFPFKPQPLTICAYDADCTDVVDLTDPTESAPHAVLADDMACAWEDLADRKIVPPSWLIADRLRTAGVAAIIVPSYVPGALGHRNLVLWRWAETPPHRLTLIDSERRLPRDDRSWED